MAHFVFRGQHYETVSSPRMGEIAVIERKLGRSMSDWYGMEQTMFGLYCSVRRAQLANGETPLMSWDDVENAEIGEWDYIEDPAPAPAAVEVPEDQWPIDPKDAATPTVPHAASDQPEQPPHSPWMTDYGPGTPSSPTRSDGPPTRSGI